MASQQSSREFTALKKNVRVLAGVVAQGTIPALLLENDLIDDEVWGFACDRTIAVTDRDKGNKVMKHVLQAVRGDPTLFEAFCTALDTESLRAGKEALHKVRETYESLQAQDESSETTKVRDEFIVLKEELQTLGRKLDNASDEKVATSATTCIKDSIQQYVENSLKCGLPLDQVKSEMKDLCDKEFAVPSALCSWAMGQVEEMSQKMASQLKVPQPLARVKEIDREPPLFCKDTIHHASLCCLAVTTCRSENVENFFSRRNPQHDLKEVSFCQGNSSFKTYLIAKKENTIYVAFQGEPALSKWTEESDSFEDGIRNQSSQIPLRFFIDQLSKDKRIVFTGFSFGGMLACYVTADLWQNSSFPSETLLKRVVCITFGQPFLPVSMVQNVITMSPHFEQSIHSILYKDDCVPQIFQCIYGINTSLPVRANQDVKSLVQSTGCEGLQLLNGKAHVPPQVAPQQMTQFCEPFIKEFLKNMAILQSASLEGLQSYAGRVSSRHMKVPPAVEYLKEAVRHMSAYDSTQLSTILMYGQVHVMSTGRGGIQWKQQKTKALAFIELGQLTEMWANQLDETLFEKHSMKEYRQPILRSYLEKDPVYRVPNPGQKQREIKELGILKPRAISIALHEYPTEHAIVLKGENLWFTHKVGLGDKRSKPCEVDTPAQNITGFSIQFNFAPSHDASSVLQSKATVRLTIYSHFSKPIQSAIPIEKKPFPFSLRQVQLAKHTPSQIIQLAYCCALLEQRPAIQASEPTRRYRMVTRFLKEAAKVVPLESIFQAISFCVPQIATKCLQALKSKNPQLCPSQMMLIGVQTAYSRACGGDLAVPVPMLLRVVSQQVFHPTRPHQPSSPNQTRSPPQARSPRQPSSPRQASSPRQPSRPQHQSTRASTRQATQLSYSDAAKNMSHGQVTQEVLVPIFGPLISTFPPPLIKYLENCWSNLCLSAQGQRELDVVGRHNIDHVYPVRSGQPSHGLTSPIQILVNARKKLQAHITASQDEAELFESQSTKISNEEMLRVLHDIFNNDVALCTALLGAFMEQQIQIPLLKSPEDMVKVLSSKAAPVAVGVWALFSLSREGLCRLLASSESNALIIEIKEYIEGVFSERPQGNEDQMYAGKLQFLLSGMLETVSCSSQYISYSLEYQLCENLKFPKTIRLHELITQWDDYFANDALSLIAKSHRPLVARWLKWTILIHDLREVLAQYTSIGVIGLVNSGKSQLVKKLFRIDSVQVGTFTTKRTTVPFLYNLEGSVDGLDVIDFPGVDDSDHTIPNLRNLLLTLAQMVVFIVDYRRISSDPAKLWLQALENVDVPILVCLTHADCLYCECMSKEADSTHMRQTISRELSRIQEKLGPHPSRTVDFYCFSLPPGQQVQLKDLKEAGIKTPTDVGDWIVHTLTTKLDQADLAQKLSHFIHKVDSQESSG